MIKHLINKKQNTLYKFLVGHFIIIFILFLSMFPFLHNVYNNLSEEAFNYQKTLITQSLTTIEKELDFLDDFAKVVRTDFNFKSLVGTSTVTPETYFTAMNAQNALYNTLIDKNIIDSYYFLFKDNDIMISPNYSIMDASLFYEQLAKVYNLTYEEFRYLIHEYTKPRYMKMLEMNIYMSNTTKKVLPFIIPIQNPYIVYSTVYDSYMITYLDLDKFIEQLLEASPDIEYFYLQSGEQILYTHNIDKANIELDHEIVYDFNSGLKLYIKVQPSTIDTYVNETFFLLLGYLLMSIVLGIALSIIFAIYHSIPVEKMRSKLASLTASVIEADNKLVQYQENEASFYLTNLINDKEYIYNANDVIKALPFLKEQYRIILLNFSMSKADVVIKNEQYIIDIKNLNTNILAAKQYSREQLLVFVKYDIATNILHKLTSELQYYIQTAISKNIICSFCISNVGQGIEKLYDTYMDADMTRRIRYEPNCDTMIDSEQIVDIRTPISIKILQSLYQHLLVGNDAEVVKTIHHIYDTLHSGPIVSNRSVRNTFFSINNILAFVISELHPPIHTFSYDGSLTVHELMSNLMKTAKDICYYVNQDKNEKTSTIIDRFKEYIAINFSDSELCPATIARYLEYSEKYLFSYVKANTGRTVNSHILEYRLLYAANELLQDNKTVQEIAESAGFYTINSFYKHFKKCFGDSPANWRKNHLGEEMIYKLDILP